MTESVTFTPKARIGDTVNVLNYRMREPQWEFGTVRYVEFSEKFGPGFSDSYGVLVPRDNNRSYVLHVGAECVELVRRATPEDSTNG